MALYLAVVLLAGCEVAALEAAVRGVPPEKQGEYGGISAIKCVNLGGAKVELPPTALNDDFCDCADGSDEPGTGACAGQDSTLFHCPNEGGTPQYLYASRVDDGVCDCCDGSDEAGLQARRPQLPKCANRCAEEGAKERAERATKIEALKAGLAKREVAIEQAKKDRAKWQGEVQFFEAQTAQLDAQVQKAKDADAAAKKVEEEARKKKDTAAGAESGGADIREEMNALKKQLEAQQKQLDALHAEVAELKKKKAAAPAGGDAAGAPAKEDDEEKQVKQVKEVSEYAKWMENAASTPGSIKEEPKLEVPEDLPMDDGEEEMDDTAAAPPASSATSTELRKAEGALRDNKDKVDDLKNKLKHLSDDRLGYSAIVDECLELNDGQYTYKACFFEKAEQDHVGLGTWNAWTGPKSGEFTNGDMCHGGPARKLNVIFECGGESKVLDIIEPSRCVYQARITTPGACDAEEAAKIEKPPVKHPRDEL